MLRNYATWAKTHYAGSMLVNLVVFCVAGCAMSVALGNGLPWFGVAIGAGVFAVIAVVSRPRAK